MTLSEQLQGNFRGDIRFRGAAYLQAERVAIIRVTTENVFAVVRDGVEYQTQLSRESEKLRMFCSCATETQAEPKCKHLWATILAVEEGGFLNGSPKPGYFPPFSSEPETLSFDIDELEDEDDWRNSDVHQPGTSKAGAATRKKQSVQPQLREWESRLQKLRSEIEATGTQASPNTAREREIFYEIDIEESQSANEMVVETSQRQRRASGQWGKLKPLRLKTGQLDDIEHQDDRKILAYLTGAAPERGNWYAQQAEMQASTYRYRIPYELSELLLPLMCSTNRVRYRGETGEKAVPLQWDDGEQFELVVALISNSDAETWRLEGRLTREGEELPLNKAKLILPGGLALTKKRISRVRDSGATAWINQVLGSEAFEIPAGEEQELVDRLFDMPGVPRLELPPELQLEEVRATPVKQLLIHSPRGPRWQHDRLRGDILFDYMGTTVRGSSDQSAIVQREEGRCILRDLHVEEEAWHEIQQLGFRRFVGRNQTGHDVEILAQDLGPAVRELINKGWQIRADGQQVRQAGEIQFQVKSGIDWFELHANIDFNGHSVAFPELLSALARGDSTVRLDDGSLGILPEQWLQQYGLLASLGVADEDHMRFSANQVGLLDALLSSQDAVDFDEKFQVIRDKLRNFRGIEQVVEPKGFQGELRVYQREGFGWLQFLEDFHFGGCLADDMGLGKTVQMLAALQKRVHQREGKTRPSLIVVPKSLMFNWFQECQRFTPDLKVVEYSGLDRKKLVPNLNKYDVILTTYGTLRRDILELREMDFDYVVLDEAQAIKNSSSQVSKASRLLQADHRVALSGTPIENHISDLWSIFEFLNPGMLGRSSVFRLFANSDEDKSSREILSRGLQPFILRRTKAQVASELPEKFEETIHCTMGEEQQRLYDELRDHYRSSLLGMVEEQGLGKSKMHVLEALLRLRQAACHPALLDRGNEDEAFAKLDALCPYLEELISEGHKALVFSQFTSMLSIVRKHLDKRNITYEYLDGQTRNRKDHVERFQNDPDCPLFLISLKAGGLGLNLTAADYVFLLDPWWNPAVEAQAIDRAHRVGQERQVFAYRLICRGTVEEKIAELQDKKRDLAKAILQEDSNLLKDLTADDLQLLLS